MSPNGDMVAVGRNGGTLEVRDVAKGHILKETKAGALTTNMSFALSGRLVAVACFDGSLHLWDIKNNSLKALSGPTMNAVWAIAFQDDGKTLSTGGGDGKVCLWDVATAKLSTRLSIGHNTRSLSFQKDNKRLAVGCGDGTVQVWDMSTFQKPHSSKLASSSISQVAYSPDGKQLAVLSEGNVHVWNPTTLKEIHVKQPCKAGVHAIAYSSNGSWLAACCKDDVTRLWDVSTQSKSVVLSSPGSHLIAHDHAGDTVVAAGESLLLWNKASTTGTNK